MQKLSSGVQPTTLQERHEVRQLPLVELQVNGEQLEEVCAPQSPLPSQYAAATALVEPVHAAALHCVDVVG
jgi:hypothetical protein